MPKLSLRLSGHISFSLSSSSPPASLRIPWLLLLRWLPFHCWRSPSVYPPGAALLSPHLYSSCCPPLPRPQASHVSQISFSFPSVHLSTCLQVSSTWKSYRHLQLKHSLSVFQKTNNNANDNKSTPALTPSSFR